MPLPVSLPTSVWQTNMVSVQRIAFVRVSALEYAQRGAGAHALNEGSPLLHIYAAGDFCMIGIAHNDRVYGEVSTSQNFIQNIKWKALMATISWHSSAAK